MKKLLLLSFLTVASTFLKAQTISIYWSSTHNDTTIGLYFHPKDTLLFNTAKDLKENLVRATGLNFTVTQMPTTLPTSGILLFADTNYVASHNQNCQITCNGSNLLTFKAKYYLGVNYGVYEYLEELGFRFYFPDTLWQVIPTVASPFAFTSKTVQPNMSIRGPAITGGIGRHPQDSTFQSNKAWYKWLDRNNIKSEYEIAGHNDWNADIRAQMTAIPCSWAEHDSSLAVNQGNMPNVTNSLAMDTWGKWMAKNWRGNQKALNNDPWVNRMRSIDLPDGTIYGNTNSFGCAAGGSYGSETDQRFILENRVTEIMQDSFPGTSTWCASYDVAADTPSVQLNPNLNISVVMGFQNEASNLALLNRWKKKVSTFVLSEYNYMSLPDYGQYPYNDLKYFKYVYKRINNWGTQGNFMETGICKFTNGMNIYALNRYAKSTKDVDVSLTEFVNDMFPSSAAPIKALFDLWLNPDAYTNGSNLTDNKHRYPKYFQLLQTASAAASGNEKKRVDEIKVYMHYLILNDKYMIADSASLLRKATDLNKYLVQISSKKIVNSYASIFWVANNEKLLNYTDTAFYWKWQPDQEHNKWGAVGGSYDPIWNTINPITDSEIDANFQQDVTDFPIFSNNYNFSAISDIVSKISANGLQAKDTVTFDWDRGAYYTAVQFCVYVTNPGFIKVIYDSLGYDTTYVTGLKVPINKDVIINFSMDSENQLHSYEKRIHSLASSSGQFDLAVPIAGKYDFTISKKTYGGAYLKFVTNGNLVYRNYAFYPTVFEKYGSIKEAASYVFVPAGQDKIYISMLDVCTSNACITDSTLNTMSVYKDPNDSIAVIKRSATDSSLYYIDVPTGLDGKFWKIYQPAGNNYGMSLSTISNKYLWLQPATPAGVREIKKINFSIYPSPSSGLFTLTMGEETDINVQVINSVGQLCFSKKYNKFNGATTIDLSELSTGIYLTKVEHNGSFSTQRIIIAK